MAFTSNPRYRKGSGEITAGALTFHAKHKILIPVSHSVHSTGGTCTVSWNEAATSPGLLRMLIRVSMFDHFQTFARGVIDAQDLAYFLSFIGFFGFLTLRVLESRKWRGRR